MTKLLKVLILEDNPDDLNLVLYQLKKADYHPEFHCVESAEDMVTALQKEQWDIILADYNMPQFTALDALEILQDKQLDIPFIIISGNIGEELAVNAMKQGASDYLMKDNLTRLVPAIERELTEASIRYERRSSLIALKESEEKFRKFF
ncbi:MAG: response regulator, partial [Spirochaetes bacterium]|nr:response regulator [Spirochaetota bacterium]